jgi:RecJ-like exonuclease
MKLESKFDLNQKIWYIENSRQRVKHQCPICDGSGKIAGKTDKKFDCPECYGKGYNITWDPTAWRVASSLTVGQITISTQNIKPDGIFCNMGHYEDGASTTKVEYMTYETGVGGGRVYQETELFETREQAETECIDRNRLDKELQV